MKIMVTFLKRSHTCAATVCDPSPAAGHHQPTPSPETPGHHRQVSYGVAVPSSLVLVHKALLCPPRVYFPVLCKFWQLYGGLMATSSKRAYAITQVSCTQSPCPCGSPLLTRISTGDAQTQFCLSLCGVPGSWCTQGLFMPSERLW